MTESTPTIDRFEKGDEGKPVVTAGGEAIGTVELVHGGVAHVRPTDELGSTVRRTLLWTPDGQRTYALRPGAVEAVDDDRIVLGDQP